MKSVKLKLLITAFLFTINYCNSQAYYPSLNNLFLSEENESVFNKETNFFRLGLRSNFNKLFYGDLQTSSNGSSTNYAAFYSLKIIPRFIFETNFFDDAIKLKFNIINDNSKYPSFPVIYNEYLNSEEETKKGKGDITINKGTVSLEFSDKLVESSSKSRSEFLIEQINYEFKNNIFEIELLGQFNNDIKIKKTKIAKSSNYSIKIVMKNNTFSMLLISKKKEIKIIDKSMLKEEVKK